MTNAQIKIKNCQLEIFSISPDKSHAKGNVIWHENGLPEFKKNFKTFSPEIVAFIETHKDANFEIVGAFSKKEGTKKGAGRFFEEVIATEIKLSE